MNETQLYWFSGTNNFGWISREKKKVRQTNKSETGVEDNMQ